MARKKKSESESDADYESVEEVDAAEDAEVGGETYTDADTGPDMVEVEVVVDHVFLPLDEAGNVPATWREAPDTVRVGKGTKLTVPADMLEMLGDKVARVA